MKAPAQEPEDNAQISLQVDSNKMQCSLKMAKAPEAPSSRVPRGLLYLHGMYVCLRKYAEVRHDVALRTALTIYQMVQQQVIMDQLLYNNQKPTIVSVYVGFKFEAIVENPEERLVRVHIQKVADHHPKGVIYNEGSNMYSMIIVPHKFFINHTMTKFIATKL